jgi:AdoMet-dependent heme synthase
VGQRPFIVIWEMTRACDLACKHCRAESQPLRNPLELDTREARSLIDEIASFGAPPPLFVMTGGDPMKRPDLTELVAYAAARHLPVAFSPSATPLLTRDVITELKAAGLKALSLSVDGSCSKIHDAFRGIDGVFERTMAAWETARELGIKVQINTTVSRLNLFDLPRVAHMVRARGAMVWSAFMLVPVGRGAALEQLSADECEDVMNFLYDVGNAIPTKTTEGHHFRRVVLERTILERRGIAPESTLRLGPTYRMLRAALEPWPSQGQARRSPMDINAGRGFVFVSHVGTVHPSGFMPIPAGNVRVQTLTEIYRQSPLFNDLRDTARLTGRCGVCEFAVVCGGSRSRAFASSGDALGDDPLCAYTPGTFPYQADIAPLFEVSGPGAGPPVLR